VSCSRQVKATQEGSAVEKNAGLTIVKLPFAVAFVPMWTRLGKGGSNASFTAKSVVAKIAFMVGIVLPSMGKRFKGL